MTATIHWPICDDCARPVDPDDAAPSCASHDLHVGCAVSFRCRGCDDALDGVTAGPTADDQPLFDFWAGEPCS